MLPFQASVVEHSDESRKTVTTSASPGGGNERKREHSEGDVGRYSVFVMIFEVVRVGSSAKYKHAMACFRALVGLIYM